MSTSFAELMKVAEQNSRSSNRDAIEAAKRREAALRQAREEQEKKERAERELQKQLMVKRIENAKQEEIRKKQREEEAKKRREELAAKREQETEHTKYAVAGSSKDGVSKPKVSIIDQPHRPYELTFIVAEILSKSNSYIVVNAGALTREEKRMAKDPLMADKLKARNKLNATKKRKDGRLPGGAVNVADSSSGSTSTAGSGLSARARIVGNFAPTLTRLNTDKRDTRTIDEITRDLKRGKIGGGPDKDVVLSGERAQSFGDWFGRNKDKGKAVDVQEPSKRKPDGPSRTREPAYNSQSPTGRSSQHAAAPSSKSAVPRKPLPAASSRPSTDSGLKPQPNGSRKRSRERSASIDDFIEDDDDYDSEEEDRYAKRRPAYGSSRRDDELGESQRDMIWKLMGKDRRQYTSIDIDSDDDMEATGADLEREEKMSYRIAKREDAEAEAEERRREMEKKRRKSEKERRG